MIVVTGALGFIASCLISKLNTDGFNEIVAVDDFSPATLFRKRNLNDKQISKYINIEKFPEWLEDNQINVYFIFH